MPPPQQPLPDCACAQHPLRGNYTARRKAGAPLGAGGQGSKVVAGRAYEGMAETSRTQRKAEEDLRLSILSG